ncbi:MAG: amidohydrolase family protein [Chloroflexota bacterium]
MDAAGIDIQCLTMTVPGVHSEEPEIGIKLAQIVNDGFAQVMSEYPNRYTALAILPLQDPTASVVELERAVTQNRLAGGMLFSHINGDNLDDEKFWPLYEKAAELDVPMFVHPIVPHHIGALADYRLVAIEGFLFDTSTAASRLIFSGVCERFPTLTWILAHLGGTLPFLAERMDRGFEVYPECREHLTKLPSSYLKQMYLDTFPHTPMAIEYTAAFSGADKILMGTDYPHQIGDLPGGPATTNQLNLSDADKALINGGNAVRVLNL